MKISILSPDLSHNCLGRSYLLAKVLKRRYEIEIIGPMFGEEIWEPCNTNEFDYKPVEGCSYPFFISSAKKMLKLIEGNVIYACKYQPTSFGIGMLKKLFDKIPLVLDIDDWEVGLHMTWHGIQSRETTTKSVRWKKEKRKITFKGIKSFIGNPNSYPYTIFMERLTKFADDITVVSNFLQEKFGGKKVPHGKDTEAFNPEKFDGEKLRKEWCIQNKKIIVFLGTPHPYKGVEDIIHAIKKLKREDVYLMAVGVNKEDPYMKKIIDIGEDKVIPVEGYRPFSEIPKFLSMADLIILPQHISPATIGQVPGKLFDAMAMAKPIISTNISDIPEILEGCGIVVEPNDIDAIAKNILYLLENEDIAEEMGKKAREKCVEKYSWDAMGKVLIEIFSKYEK